MSYIVTGAICLVIGAGLGVLAMGLCVASKNNEYSVEDRQHREEDTEE